MAKTIFNTSEESNFILNLTAEKYSRMAAISLILPCILISLATIPCEFNIKKISYPIISGALAVCGVISMIMAIIAFIKGYIKGKRLVPVLFFATMILWGVISLVNSYDKTVSLYGFDGRGEGLLAIIFYFCFFVTAASVSVDKFKIYVSDTLVIAGAVNALWAIPQIFIDSMPSKYDYVTQAGEINAASGLSQSPIFLAMFLSFALVTAVIGGILSECRRRRILYIISAVLFSFVMIFTYSLTAVIGLCIAAVTGVITVIFRKADKKHLLKIGGVIISAVCAVLLINSGAVCENSSYKLHDGVIMWFDSFNRLGSSGNYKPDEVNADDTAEVYKFLTSKTAEIISEYPLVGTGPENLVYPQLYSSYEIFENSGTFDKNYNEYLYIAATRGIPSLIAYLGIIVSVIWLGIKNLKSNGSVLTYTAFCMVITGLIIFAVGAGNITFSPVFWIFCGFLICSDEKTQKSK